MAAKRTPGPAAAGLRQVIDGFGSKRLRVGFFETAKYEDGTPVAYVATIHEYGWGPIPPRPFMRPTAEREKPQWDAHLKAGAGAVARGQFTADQVLGQIGQLAAADISVTISQITTPPLAPATIRDKQRAYVAGTTGPVGQLSKPLVRTGLLIASPTYQVDG